MAKIQWLIIGVIEICCLYFLPVGRAIGSGFVTIQQMTQICSNPLISALTVGGNNSSCMMYNGVFLIGWITGLIFIVYGLLARDNAKTPCFTPDSLNPFFVGRFGTDEPRQLFYEVSQIITKKEYQITQEELNITQDSVGSGGIINARYSFMRSRRVNKIDNSSNKLWAIALFIISIFFITILLIFIPLLIICGYLYFFRKPTTNRDILFKNEIFVTGKGTFIKTNAGAGNNPCHTAEITLSISNVITPVNEFDTTIFSAFKADCDEISDAMRTL